MAERVRDTMVRPPSNTALADQQAMTADTDMATREEIENRVLHWGSFMAQYGRLRELK